MNLEFSDDQKFVQTTAREFLTANATLQVDRAVFESDASYDESLWKKVAEMGWLGTTVPEAYGGTGLGYLELVLLAQEMGRSLAPIPFASSVYGATEAILLCGTEEQKQKWLPLLSSGERIGCVAFSEALGDSDVASLETAFGSTDLLESHQDGHAIHQARKSSLSLASGTQTFEGSGGKHDLGL